MQKISVTVVAFLGFLSVLQMSSAALRHDLCQDKAADIVFVLDTSSSISVSEFDDQKRFVLSIIDNFDIGFNMTRVALVTYSNYAHTAVDLNAHFDRHSLAATIRQIASIRGDTNTEHALKHVRTIVLASHNGGRYGVAQVVILLTDGKSNNAFKTYLEANKLHEAGVYIFSIGIGDQVDKDELKAYATKPAEKFSFHVQSSRALGAIRDVLSSETCRATEAPTTVAPPTLAPLNDQACGDVNAADVVFAIAPSSSTEHTDKALAFYREFANQLEVSSDKVRVGLVPKDCNAVPGMDLDDYADKGAILAMLQDLEYAEDTPAKVLRHMRMVSFSPKHGSRRHARKLGVLIIDESVQNFRHAQSEASKARMFGRIELFVIGVGTNINLAEVNGLATKPLERHVFRVDTYDDLLGIATTVRKAVCPYAYIPSL